MRNAKKELLQLLEGKAKVKCATITNGDKCDEDNKDILLKVGYSENEWTEFLKSLNFSYEPGYGGQHLFGTVWLEDGTWCTRSEYDCYCSEWWEHNQLPEIPSVLFFEEEKKEEDPKSVEMVKEIFRNMGISI